MNLKIELPEEVSLTIGDGETTIYNKDSFDDELEYFDLCKRLGVVKITEEDC